MIPCDVFVRFNGRVTELIGMNVILNLKFKIQIWNLI